MRAPTREGVLRAAAKIAALLPPTPLLPVEIGGATVWAKAECLQPIGAFKIRGAWHRLSDLSDERARARRGRRVERQPRAGRRLGGARARHRRDDRDAARRAGGEARAHARARRRGRALRPRHAKTATRSPQALVDERGATLVHAYADPWVIEGQGSAGIEIAAQMER